MDAKKWVRAQQRVWEGLFDPHQRWQFFVISHGGEGMLIVKGAAESIMPRSTVSESQREKILSNASEYGKKGLRVLAVARTRMSLKKTYGEADVRNLEFLGLLTFEDPVKPTAAPALTRAAQLGLKVKILTGDSPEVALSVARQVGMDVQPHEIVTGDTLPALRGEGGYDRISLIKIFARVNPSEKYDIIQALAKHYSVMFLGEGINDAPALKSADVGMVVQEASDIAKESADVVLTKPDLSVIIDSIHFGKQIMSNIAKYILITLTGNFGALYAISMVSLISPLLPLLPTQILLENILTDVPMISLVNSHREEGAVRRRASHTIKQIAFSATILGISTLFVQFIFYRMFIHLPHEVFRTLWRVEIVLFEFMLIISLRTTELFWKGRKLDPDTFAILVGVSCGIIALPFIPPVNGWFHLQPYPLSYLVPVGAIILLGMGIIEVMKKYLFRSRLLHELK
jgi:Mg2+-importing ATPase